jgi:hypothetical protein
MAKAKKGIVLPVIPANERGLRFSFLYLQADHKKFPLSACTAEYLSALIERIKLYETYSVDAFKTEDHEQHRHCLTFGESTEPDGFPNIDPTADDLWTDDSWQFCLPGVPGEESWGWRVHGFINKYTFYIVWLDPHHQLCKRKA